MTTQEVANRFHELAQTGKWDQIQDELYSPQAISIEPHAQGLPNASGLAQIKEKSKQWASMIEEVHGGFCNAPQVVSNYFSCVMGIDATMKGQGRSMMDEIALYEVKDGKIVREQFFF